MSGSSTRTPQVACCSVTERCERGAERSVLVVDVTSGDQVCLLEGHRRGVFDAAFLAEGAVVSCSQDGTVLLWRGAGA